MVFVLMGLHGLTDVYSEGITAPPFRKERLYSPSSGMGFSIFIFSSSGVWFSLIDTMICICLIYFFFLLRPRACGRGFGFLRVH